MVCTTQNATKSAATKISSEDPGLGSQPPQMPGTGQAPVHDADLVGEHGEPGAGTDLAAFATTATWSPLA